MAYDRNGERSSLVPIDWWPDCSRLAAIVRRNRVRCDASGRWRLNDSGALMETGVSKYKDWELRDQHLMDLHGERVFGGVQNGPSGSETMVEPAHPRPGRRRICRSAGG